MLSIDISRNLIGLKDIIVKKVEQTEKNIDIYVQLEIKEQYCPCCGTATRTIHDYRTQVVKDIPAFGKQIRIVLRKRRYRCPCCKKRFTEKNTFLPRYYRMTSRLALYVIDKLRNEHSFTSVARSVSLSTTTVIRIFDHVSFKKPVLPQVVSIDEFKGNTDSEKYQCIITDPVSHKVLDILPKRTNAYLSTYFKHTDRDNVRFFISDMWRPYADIRETYFKNATLVIDKYHWIRQVTWAFEAVRKEVQKQFSKSHRIYFKHSRQLLLKRLKYLSDDEKQQVNVMLYASPTLSSAYFLKENFQKLLDCDSRSTAKFSLLSWIEDARSSGIHCFQKCAETMHNWLSGILNSFDCPYTNGFTEGCNNKIKVLKRNAYGYRNFQRFRKRILLMFSHQNQVTA